jgi:hypothetical protein
MPGCVPERGGRLVDGDKAGCRSSEAPEGLFPPASCLGSQLRIVRRISRNSSRLTKLINAGQIRNIGGRCAQRRAFEEEHRRASLSLVGEGGTLLKSKARDIFLKRAAARSAVYTCQAFNQTSHTAYTENTHDIHHIVMRHKPLN